MNEYSVHYYDGNRSAPRNARIEIQNGAILLYDGEGYEGRPLVFPLNTCKASQAGGNLFVYLGKTGVAYLEVPGTSPHYTALLALLQGQPTGIDAKLHKQKWPVLVLALCAVFALVYLCFTQLLPGVALRLISREQEKVLGEKIYRSVLTDSEVDHFQTQQLQAFADQLHLSDQYAIRVTVVKNKEVNAFALPGGHIVVYSGILRVMESPETAAGLLGHEATHINQRHSLRGMLSGIGWSLLRSIVFSGFGDMGNVVLSNAGSLHQLSYSRKLEREADRKGMELLVRNHIDPAGMKTLMLALQKVDKGILPAFSFISTHPLTEERIKNADDFIQQHKNAKFATDSSLNRIWKQLKDPR